MKFVFSYAKKYKWVITGTMLLKALATFMELMIPYVLEHLVDNVAPTKDLTKIFVWGAIMLVMAFAARFFNVKSNRRAVKVSSLAAYEVRRDLF